MALSSDPNVDISNPVIGQPHVTQPVIGQTENDIAMALKLSQQQLEEDNRRRKQEEEELEMILKLSLTEK